MPLRYANTPTFTKQIRFTADSVPCSIEYFSHKFRVGGRVSGQELPNVRYEGIKFNGMKVTTAVSAERVRATLNKLIVMRKAEINALPFIFSETSLVRLHRAIVDMQVCEHIAQLVAVCGDLDFANTPEDLDQAPFVPEAIGSITGRQNT